MNGSSGVLPLHRRHAERYTRDAKSHEVVCEFADRLRQLTKSGVFEGVAVDSASETVFVSRISSSGKASLFTGIENVMVSPSVSFHEASIFPCRREIRVFV